MESKKVSNKILVILALLAIIFPLIGSGCNGRTESEQEADRKKAEYDASPEGQAKIKQHEANQKRLDEIEAQRLAEAAANREAEKSIVQKTEEKILSTGIEALKSVNFYVQENATQPAGNPVQIFKIGNDNAVSNGGTDPKFTLDKSFYVTDLWTYHYNNKQGAPAGTIGLSSPDGRIYGPWDVEVVNGVYWKIVPKIILGPGSYTILDSDPKTLSQNSGTNGMGMAWMNGIPTK